MKKRGLLVAALVPFLMGNEGGCGTSTQPTVVRVVTDNYCRLTERQSWSVHDTTETIEGVRRSEAKRLCTCVRPKPAECSRKDATK